MITLIGLGNPGKKYMNNRHNVGHLFIDFLNNKSLNNQEIKLIKTDCFMNQSGLFFKNKLHVNHASLSKLMVIHDDLDIPLGKFHIQKGVGPQLHNGLESIEMNIKSKDFWRIRIGVDGRSKDKWINGIDYVLQDFLVQEREKLENEILPKVSEQLKIFLKTEFSIML